MKILILLSIFIQSVSSLMAQSKYFTKAGKISFYSKAPLENIEAINNKAVSVWDAATGQMEFAVLMKGFEFEKALMQDHFNENYVESDKFPKAVFKGTIDNSNAISLTTDNVVTVKVSGFLTLHGVTNPVNTIAVITVKNGVVAASCNFSIVLSDYKITIPSVVSNKINKRVAIAVSIPAYQAFATK